ncbi:Heparan sulfate 2-O-sulfotransferase 1 [Elysia marginata]|uniref:Heparan sulfate 2-O-sulfotransferase 1 n=1 Tax=Elysia marginata TaxID=1093978 RepID=A0AAV4IHW3_9GAST|nr:Heparan sulfate 2-O-sulfotransferase 1 [Elysia marginata]
MSIAVLQPVRRSNTNSPHISSTAKSQKEQNSEDDTVVIYNRIPKTGSTSLKHVVAQLSIINNFNWIHFNTTRFLKVFGLADQRRFITNITNWEEKKPAFYDGHLAFIDFSRFGIRKLPIYINVVREPLARLMSHYYFLRYGDNYDPNRVRKKAHDHRTFDDCVAMDGEDCGPAKMWVQVPFFCGHSEECWSVLFVSQTS